MEQLLHKEPAGQQGTGRVNGGVSLGGVREMWVPYATAVWDYEGPFRTFSGRRWTRHAAFGMESITQEVHALDVNQRCTGKRSKICALIMAATGPWQPPGLDLQKSGPLIMAAARPLQTPALDLQKL